MAGVGGRSSRMKRIEGPWVAIGVRMFGSTLKAPVNIELVAASSTRWPYHFSMRSLSRAENTMVVPTGGTFAGLGVRLTALAFAVGASGLSLRSSQKAR